MSSAEIPTPSSQTPPQRQLPRSSTPAEVPSLSAPSPLPHVSLRALLETARTALHRCAEQTFLSLERLLLTHYTAIHTACAGSNPANCHFSPLPFPVPAAPCSSSTPPSISFVPPFYFEPFTYGPPATSEPQPSPSKKRTREEDCQQRWRHLERLAGSLDKQAGPKQSKQKTMHERKKSGCRLAVSKERQSTELQGLEVAGASSRITGDTRQGRGKQENPQDQSTHQQDEDALEETAAGEEQMQKEIEPMTTENECPPEDALPTPQELNFGPAVNLGIQGSRRRSGRRQSLAVATERVTLDVGGALFETTVGTLTQRSSMLASMFSGRFSMTTDEEGTHFIDRDPTLFAHILRFLRNGTVSLKDSDAAGNSKDKKRKREGLRRALLYEAEYYQLQELVDSLRSGPSKQSLVRELRAFAVASPREASICWASIQRLAGSSLDPLGPWTQTPIRLPGPHFGCGIALSGQVAYLIGGESEEEQPLQAQQQGQPQAQQRQRQATAEVTSVELQGEDFQVRREQAMGTARARPAVATCGGYVYVMGGHAGTLAAAGTAALTLGPIAMMMATQSAERYDLERRRWSPIAPMAFRRSAARAASLDGRVFVLGGVCWAYEDAGAGEGGAGGGRLVRMIHDTMEEYEEATDQWRVLPMPFKKLNFGVAAVAGGLYVVGGYDVDDVDGRLALSDSVWVYYPTHKTRREGGGEPDADAGELDEEGDDGEAGRVGGWSRASPLLRPGCPEVMAVDGQLLAVDRSGLIHKYNPHTDKWLMVNLEVEESQLAEISECVAL